METKGKYIIELENKAVVTVNLHQLFKPRWIEYFGSVEGVRDFIKNYNN